MSEAAPPRILYEDTELRVVLIQEGEPPILCIERANGKDSLGEVQWEHAIDGGQEPIGFYDRETIELLGQALAKQVLEAEEAEAAAAAPAGA